jgi:hypothetical protein
VAVPGGLPCGRCRATAKPLDQKGTAVPKDTHSTATTGHTRLELPEQVTVAVAGLQALLAVGQAWARVV